MKQKCKIKNLFIFVSLFLFLLKVEEIFIKEKTCKNRNIFWISIFTFSLILKSLPRPQVYKKERKQKWNYILINFFVFSFLYLTCGLKGFLLLEHIFISFSFSFWEIKIIVPKKEILSRAGVTKENTKRAGLWPDRRLVPIFFCTSS